MGYKLFHDCVYAVISQLRSGGAQIGLSRALELLETAWQESGPRGHAYESLYRTLAEKLLAQYCAPRDGKAVRGWRDYVDVPLGGAIVRVSIDSSEVKDGTVRLIRTHTGRPSDDHKRAERLALLRRGVRDALEEPLAVSVELEYLSTGETVEVPYSARYEPDRVMKLEQAVHGILAGHFPAQPKEARECATCPYWIVCPS